MGRPIIVDDGGSFRIKLVVAQGSNSKGEMDSLFTISNHKSDHDVKSNVHGSYDKVSIFDLEENGNLNQYSYAGTKFKRILIKGDLGVDVEFNKDPGQPGGQGAKIYLSGNGLDPILESREHDRNRSYNVSNAGRISEIEIEDSNKQTTQVPLAPDRLYTIIVIT